MEFLTKFITKQNLIRSAVFSVLTTGIACFAVVLAKYSNGDVFSVTRIVASTTAVAIFLFLVTLTLLTVARMDRILVDSKRAKKIRVLVILLSCLCLGVLVYLNSVFLYPLIPFVLIFYTAPGANFRVALLVLACLFLTGSLILL